MYIPSLSEFPQCKMRVGAFRYAPVSLDAPSLFKHPQFVLVPLHFSAGLKSV